MQDKAANWIENELTQYVSDLIGSHSNTQLQMIENFIIQNRYKWQSKLDAPDENPKILQQAGIMWGKSMAKIFQEIPLLNKPIEPLPTVFDPFTEVRILWKKTAEIIALINKREGGYNV